MLTSLAGCKDMVNQPRYEPLEGSSFFANGQASRPLVDGTVARGNLRIDKAYFEGIVDKQPVSEFPLQTLREQMLLTGDQQNPISQEEAMTRILKRGQQRFDIFCAACHDRSGSGQGMVVQRGFPAPPSIHTDLLREAPVGHYFDVVSNGFGRMPAYASQIPPDDRWAIIAYVRALQLSQHAEVNSLPAQDREALIKGESQTKGPAQKPKGETQ